MYLGCHVSIAGGFDKCIDRIVERGGKGEIDAYLKKKLEYKIGPHFFHGVYLVNLATPKADYLQASIDSLVFYQKFAGMIGGGTIFHI